MDFNFCQLDFFADDVNEMEINVSRISTTYDMFILIEYANSEGSDEPVKTRILVSLYGVHTHFNSI